MWCMTNYVQWMLMYDMWCTMNYVGWMMMYDMWCTMNYDVWYVMHNELCAMNDNVWCVQHDELCTMNDVWCLQQDELCTTNDNVWQWQKKVQIFEIFRRDTTPVVMVLKRSWPAVSQICSLTRFPSSSIVRILKSILQQQISTPSDERSTYWKSWETLENGKQEKAFKNGRNPNILRREREREG